MEKTAKKTENRRAATVRTMFINCMSKVIKTIN